MSPVATPVADQHRVVGTLVLLYAMAGGVAWWVAHLVTLSALAPASCEARDVQWLMHGVTLACAIGTLAALGASAAVKAARGGTALVVERNRFVGTVAIAFNLASLALILLEDVPVWFVRPC